jgi:hypothetical protein
MKNIELDVFFFLISQEYCRYETKGTYSQTHNMLEWSRIIKKNCLLCVCVCVCVCVVVFVYIVCV